MSDDPALDALMGAKTIAVVGLDTAASTGPRTGSPATCRTTATGSSPSPCSRPADEVLGERAYPSLREVPEPVDLVDVFVRAEHTDPIIDDAIAIGAKAVWLQLGIRNEEGVERARAAGLAATHDRCAMVEHARALR